MTVEIFGPVIIRLRNVHDVVHVFFGGLYVGTSSSFFLRLGLKEHVFETYTPVGGTFQLQVTPFYLFTIFILFFFFFLWSLSSECVCRS